MLYRLARVSPTERLAGANKTLELAVRRFYDEHTLRYRIDSSGRHSVSRARVASPEGLSRSNLLAVPLDLDR